MPTPVAEILHSKCFVPRRLFDRRIDRRFIDALSIDAQHEIANAKPATRRGRTILHLRDHHALIRLEVRQGTNRIRNGRDCDAERRVVADVAVVASIVPNIIDGVGLMGTDDHSDKETADLRTLPTQTKKAALLLHRIGRK